MHIIYDTCLDTCTAERREEELESIIKNLEDDRKRHTKQLVTLEEKLADFEVNSSSLDTRLSQRNNQVTDLQSELTERSNQINHLEREVKCSVRTSIFHITSTC